jgi:hypothetical protein
MSPWPKRRVGAGSTAPARDELGVEDPAALDPAGSLDVDREKDR